MPRRASAAETCLDQPASLPQAPAGWHSGPLLSPSPGDSSPTLPGSRWPWQRKMALVTRTWVSSVPITRRTRRLRSFRAGCMSRGHSDVLACGAWVLAAGSCGDVLGLGLGLGLRPRLGLRRRLLSSRGGRRAGCAALSFGSAYLWSRFRSDCLSGRAGPAGRGLRLLLPARQAGPRAPGLGGEARPAELGRAPGLQRCQKFAR